MSTLDFILNGLAAAVASGETTLDDVVARIGNADADSASHVTDYPTLAAHVAAVTRGMKKETRDTWNTHYRRLLDGTAEFCACTCDACLDLDTGCQCGCGHCADRVCILSQKDLVLRPKSVRASQVEGWVRVAQRMAAKKAVRENQRRAKKGLAAKPTHGKGGRENAVTAYRHLFGKLVKDELWSSNPASKVEKPRRDDTVRRSLHDDEVGPFFDAVVSGGDDPELDFHLTWFHMESGARREGGVDLRMADIKRATQMLRLHEKGDASADQPVSAELLDALIGFAISRGGSVCDPTSPDYDPSAPVFYYKDHRPDRPHPLTDRRYDTLYQRVQKTLPWAAETMLTNHSLRKTGASIVERIAGTEAARLYLRHGRRNTTNTYTEASMRRLAEAIEVYTGRPHPATGHVET